MSRGGRGRTEKKEKEEKEKFPLFVKAYTLLSNNLVYNNIEAQIVEKKELQHHQPLKTKNITTSQPYVKPIATFLFDSLLFTMTLL